MMVDGKNLEVGLERASREKRIAAKPRHTIHRRDDNDPEKPWQFLALAELVKERLDVFVNNASPAKLHDKVRASVQASQFK